MCGRVAIYTSKGVIVKHFGITDDQIRRPWERKYNVPPTTRIPAMHGHGQTRILSEHHWGMPRDDGGRLVINARAESLAQMPLFRPALGKGHAAVPVDGFYEWRTTGSKKQPFLVRRQDRQVMALAALRRTLTLKDGTDADCVVVITTEPNRVMEPIHERMPVVLDRAGVDEWLALTRPTPGDLRGILAPAPDDDLEALPVSDRVNSSETEDAELVKPLATLEGGDRRSRIV